MKAMNFLRLISLIFHREYLIFYRRRNELLRPLLFFLLVCTLFPLACSPDHKLLLLFGPGVIWVAALLALMLSLRKLYQDDYYDGSIVQFIQSPYSLSFLLLVKIIAHWVIYGLPLILISPLLALMYYLPSHAILILILGLSLGTLVLSLLGSIMAALTVGIKNNSMLLSLLIFPLYIPVLIFAASSVVMAESNIPVIGMMAILGAMLIMALLISPLASAFALRIGVHLDSG